MKQKGIITLENLQDKRKNINVHLLVIMMIVIQVISEWTPGCEDLTDFDVIEYQKFIQKIFPSKNQKEKIRQMNKIDKMINKKKNVFQKQKKQK